MNTPVHGTIPLQAADDPAPAPATRRPWVVAVMVVSAALVAVGLMGRLQAAWGYALFGVASVFLIASVASFGVLALTDKGRTDQLLSTSRSMGMIGAAAYVLALAALAGHYTGEALRGRIEMHWMVFGPLVLAALIAFDMGIYRKLVKANLTTLRRYRRFIGREDAEPAAMRKTLVDDVIVHRSLWQVSKLRWVRHTLIFWGFAAMFMIELPAVFVREGLPAFGWPDVWRIPGHPVRLAFDVMYDLTGAMVLIGCLLALWWRFTVRDKPDERKFADTPMVLFLLFVVVSGFAIEGWRIAQTSSPLHSYSFVGVPFASLMSAVGLDAAPVFQPLWLAHVIASVAFIGYLPVTRLVHTCATPFGRLMTSQKGLLAAKKYGVLSGLMHSPGPAAPLQAPSGTSRTNT